jgi:hypothetical protein
MAVNRLAGTEQQPAPPNVPVLRAAVTCSKVTSHDDGTFTLEGVGAGFTPKWRPTPAMPAPVEFCIYCEILAIDCETVEGETLVIELRSEAGLRRIQTQQSTFGRGKRVVVPKYTQHSLMLTEAPTIVKIRCLWGERVLGEIPLFISAPGAGPSVELFPPTGGLGQKN